MDLDEIALKWFTTTSHEHPGVARLFREGKHFLAGEVKLLERQPSQNRHYELTPKQTRFIFAHKGWSRIIGFHTRNPVHRGHEYIQKKALEISGADGLYLNPVVGPKKNGDFKHTHIMKSYQTMLEYGLYPEGKTMLGSFATYPRYGGPREAVYTALCRKNMGCSHFIIGRDHTGVGDFYDPTANERLFKSLGDIGIKPLFFSPVGYNRDLDCYEEETIDNKESLLAIDGTSIRDSLRLGGKVEDWIMREIIQEALLDFTPEGDTMFVTDFDE